MKITAKQARDARKISEAYARQQEEQELSRVKKKAAKLVGLRFAYENSVSPDNTWEEYAEIIGIDEDEGMVLLNIFTPKNHEDRPSIVQSIWYLSMVEEYLGRETSRVLIGAEFTGVQHDTLCALGLPCCKIMTENEVKVFRT